MYWQTQIGFEYIWLMDRKNGDPGFNSDDFQKTRVIFLNSPSVFYHLATAKYWIRESEVASPGLNPRKQTLVIQLWHAAGAFKKFGLDIKNRNDDLKRYRLKDATRWDLLLCSSKKVAPIYCRAFGGFDKQKILISGLPRNDVLFLCQNRRNEIKRQFNIPEKNKLILYAPTFRDTKLGDTMLKEVINFLILSLPENFTLGIRLHPAVATKIDFKEHICNLTFYDTEPVLSITDMLITDYSSIIFDFALLERPMLFYSPDIDEYIRERGLYFKYNTFIPGPFCKTKESLLNEILDYDTTKWHPVIKKFKQDFQPDFDGCNSKRVFERIIKIEK